MDGMDRPLVRPGCRGVTLVVREAFGDDLILSLRASPVWKDA
jgi:hypothetical protein